MNQEVIEDFLRYAAAFEDAFASAMQKNIANRLGLANEGSS